MRRAPLPPLALLCSTLLVAASGCEAIRDRLGGGGAEDEPEEGGDGDAGGDDSAKATSGADGDDGDDAGGDAGGGGGDGLGDERAPTATGPDRYKAWAPVHAFIAASVTTGAVVGGSEAIVATRDNHVGVTSDAGKTWGFARITTGDVSAVGGYAGGPYFVVGRAGFAAMSEDGHRWHDLPRHTGDDLIGLVAAELGVFAIGRTGAWIRYGKAGDGGDGGVLPDRFKAKALTELNGTVVAVAGKTAYGTADGTEWTRMEQAPLSGGDRNVPTSSGMCSLGKVGRNRGVVCAVVGTAYGITAASAVVERKGLAQTTRDGGKTWTVAALPMKSANAVFGAPGSPLYAVGSGGAVAVSKDGGETWVDQKWEESANLRDGLANGSLVLIVGDGGTIIYSKDGGKSWEYAEPPAGGNFSRVVNVDGKYVVTDGRVALRSADGKTWEELPELPELPGAGADCSGLPAPGQRCAFDAGTTTPDDLPDVRGFAFSGNAGLAWGDFAMVAFSGDGGTSWTATSGVGLKGASLIEVDGDAILVSDTRRIVYSNDGGSSFSEGLMPGKYSLYAMHIATDGTAYAAGKGGVLLRSTGEHKIWLPVETAPKDRTTYVAFFEVNEMLYAAGTKGELWRSENGEQWSRVDTGTRNNIQAMTGDGTTVLAVTTANRKGGNLLLRSDDNGQHFYVVTEMSHAGRADDFELVGGKLSYRDRISEDMGQSWRRRVESYWPGAVDLEDGSGKFIVNLDFGYEKDRLYVVGDAEDDWVLIDSVFNEGARFECDPKTGCWMIAGGTVYRPLQ